MQIGSCLVAHQGARATTDLGCGVKFNLVGYTLNPKTDVLVLGWPLAGVLRGAMWGGPFCQATGLVC